MYPTLVDFGALAIHSYGLMFAFGFLAAIGVTIYFGKKAGLTSELVLDMAIYIMLAAIVGARLFYVIGQWHLYRSNLLEIFMIQRGGLVYLGGFLLGLLVVYFYAKLKKIPFLRLYDVLAPGVVMANLLGRIGCFLNGCCFGLPAKLPWAIIFPAGSLAGSYFPDDHLHPTQIYSVLGLLLVFVLLTYIFRRKKFDGQVFYSLIILYSIHRFVVEFFRYSPIHWLGLTPSQWIVMLLFAVGTFFLVRRARGG